MVSGSIVLNIYAIPRMTRDIDIENLLLNPNTDLDYIKKWCDILKLQTFNLLDHE